jgi:hypothetical protein
LNTLSTTPELTPKQRAQYEAHMKAGLSHNIALMLAAQKAPEGKVKGSAHPTKDWGRDKR